MFAGTLPEVSSQKNLVFKKISLITIILVELLMGGGLWLWFQNSHIKNQILGTQTTAVQLKKDDFVFPTDAEFKYYYEPIPSITQEDKPYWLPYVAHYTSNQDGLNNQSDYTTDKSSDTFRILALGDSFTYGLYVDTADSWPAQLEKKLNDRKLLTCSWERFEVLNLGVAGHDAPYVIERYKRKGLKYESNLILWLESETGFYRYNEEMQTLINPCTDAAELLSDPIEKQKVKQKCFDDAHAAVSEKFPEHILFSTILKKHYDDFFSLISSHTFKMYTFESKAGRAWTQLQEQYPKITFLATVPDLTQRKEVVADGHPSVEGHTTIATTIFEDIKKEHPECF